MPTIIDSLVVELGIDGRSMSTGTRKAQQDYKKLRDDATKTGKDLSEAGKRGSEFFVKMRNEALAFFAVFTAGKGLRAFVSDTVASNVALGNLSRNLNTGARTLDAWQRTARSFGASAGSISSLYQSIQNMSQTQSGRLDLSRLSSLTGVSFVDQATGKLKNFDAIMSQLNRTAQGMDAGRFQAIIGMLGGGTEAATVLEQNSGALSGRYRQMQRYAATPQDVQASQELLADWVRLTSQSEQLGRSFVTHLEPGFHAVLKNLSNWIDKHPEFQRAIERDGDALAKFLAAIDWDKVGKTVDTLEKKIEGLDWKGIGTDLSSLKGDFEDLTKLTGGWATATELLIGLWAGSKFATMLSGIRLVTTLMTAGPLGRLLAIAAVPTIGAVAAYTLVKGGSPPLARNEGLSKGAGPAANELKVRAEAARQGVDPDWAVAVARQESGARQVDANGKTVTSPKGALGLFQLEPGTAKELDVDPTDVDQNIRGGVAYLKQQLAAAGGNREVATAAYNAGLHAKGVQRLLASRNTDYSELPPETRDYVAGIDATYAKLRHPGRRPVNGLAKAEARVEKAANRFADQFDLSAFTNTDSPALYSRAMLSVAAHPASVSHNTSHETTIREVHVHIKSTDPKGAAREVGAALANTRRLAAVGNTGLQ